MGASMLGLYFDEDGENEVLGTHHENGDYDPDTIREPVEQGEDGEFITELYLITKDEDLTFEDIYIEAEHDEDDASESGEINVEFSLDDVDYQDKLNIPDDDFSEPVKIYRRVTAPSVDYPFKREDIIYNTEFKAFVKEMV